MGQTISQDPPKSLDGKETRKKNYQREKLIHVLGAGEDVLKNCVISCRSVTEVKRHRTGPLWDAYKNIYAYFLWTISLTGDASLKLHLTDR